MLFLPLNWPGQLGTLPSFLVCSLFLSPLSPSSANLLGFHLSFAPLYTIRRTVVIDIWFDIPSSYHNCLGKNGWPVSFISLSLSGMEKSDYQWTASTTLASMIVKDKLVGIAKNVYRFCRSKNREPLMAEIMKLLDKRCGSC